MTVTTTQNDIVCRWIRHYGRIYIEESDCSMLFCFLPSSSFVIFLNWIHAENEFQHIHDEDKRAKNDQCTDGHIGEGSRD